MGKWVAVLALAVLVSGCVVREGPYRSHYRSGPVYVERGPEYRPHYRPAPPPHPHRHGPPRERHHRH
ncbi:hypothetical protein [Elstera litoralis]|uniref:hypothetical protein n=1 Tax=Elstera litoralis TaxID=552518 RepID=UPI0012ED3324|nr:hypothetical protein [Elstera litoralis]